MNGLLGLVLVNQANRQIQSKRQHSEMMDYRVGYDEGVRAARWAQKFGEWPPVDVRKYSKSWQLGFYAGTNITFLEGSQK